MSKKRDGESDDPLDWGRYEAAKRSAIRGRRGQRLLRDLIEGLDALPKPELSAGALGDRRNGCVCALGAVALQRGEKFDKLAKDNGEWGPDGIVFDALLDISVTLANEVMSTNDDWCDGSNMKADRRSRWRHVKAWAENQIISKNETTEDHSNGPT
jgi:hypothetical protein